MNPPKTRPASPRNAQQNKRHSVQQGARQGTKLTRQNSLRLIQLGMVLVLFIASSLPLFAQTMHTLTITAQAGGVVQAATDIACGTQDRYGSRLPRTTTVLNNCSHPDTAGSMVELRAIPNNAHNFIGWLGDCSGGSSRLTLTMDAAKTCRAAFARSPDYIQVGIRKVRINIFVLQFPDFACALRSRGSVQCWGGNANGQLGDGTTSPRSTPTAVVGINNAVAIAVGTNHACAVLNDGEARCWGDNRGGQIGDGAVGSNRRTPTTVLNISNAVTITAGTNYTCAVLSDGQARCWGNNFNGELGNGMTGRSNTPAAVLNINNAIAISAGNAHTCAVLSDGQARCWGLNANGEVGDGTRADRRVMPVAVLNINNAVAISAGNVHTCAVLSDGEARCWGNNTNGELGSGTGQAQHTTPTKVSNITNATAIAAGNNYTCAVLSDGQARCWGRGREDQIGDGDDSNDSRLTPAGVSGINTAAQIATGRVSSCLILGNGLLYCWGDDDTNTTAIVAATGVAKSNAPRQVVGQALTPARVQRAGTPNQLFVFQPRVAISDSVWSTSDSPAGFSASRNSGALYGVSNTTRTATDYTLSAQSASGTHSIVLTLSIIDTLRLHLKLFLEGPLR